MSWKNFASFALAALLASPVIAAPTLKVTSGGLNSNGDFVWDVTVAADSALFVGGGSSLAAELGFAAATAGSGLVSTPTIVDAVAWDTANPGNDPFAAIPNIPQPTGIVRAANEVFVGYGSSILTTNADRNLIQIVTQGPAVLAGRSLTSSVVVSGAYSGLGRIAQEGLNYDVYGGTASRTVLEGDVNLSGSVTTADFLILQNNFGQPGAKNWTTGDFNGSGTVTTSDFLILQNKFGQSGGSLTNLVDSSAVVAAAAVPEPASLALAGVLLLGSYFARRTR